MKNYGVPYKGSKSRIVDKMAKEAIPWGVENFYDLFAGGCAMIHRVMEGGKFAHYYANDLDGRGLRLFADAVDGKYKDEKRWISREDFAVLKGTDPYVSICWSFGNSQDNYLYSREIEPWKKAVHYARVLGDTSLLREFGIDSDGSRMDITAHMDEYKRKYIRWWLDKQSYSREELYDLISRYKGDIEIQSEELRQYLISGLKSSGLTQADVQRRLGTQMGGHYFGRSQWQFPAREHYVKMQTFMPSLDKSYDELVGLRNLWQSLESLESLERLQRLESLERLQRLESLQRLQRLQRLESLERLQRLEIYTLDYRDVAIQKNSIVYCDPPYKGTSGYEHGGNSLMFDHEGFYEWCESQSELVLVSEYSMPKDRFVEVWCADHRSIFGSTANKAVTERLFVPKGQKDRYDYLMSRSIRRCVQLSLF